MQGETRRAGSETNPKPLRLDEFKSIIGAAIQGALIASKLQHKEAADLMGYGDNLASLSNWIRGEETPQFAKLWMLGPRFRQELVIALAEQCGIGVEVEKVIRIRRPA